MRRDLAFVSFALVGIGLVVLDDYRVVGGIALAYLMLWLGATLAVRLGMTNDISYGIYIYGFPIQQTFVMLGIAGIGWFTFAIVGLAATIPLAALSWWLIERPSLRLKGLLSDRQPSEEVPVSGSGGPDFDLGMDSGTTTTATRKVVWPATAPAITTAIMGLLFLAYYLLGTARA